MSYVQTRSRRRRGGLGLLDFSTAATVSSIYALTPAQIAARDAANAQAAAVKTQTAALVAQMIRDWEESQRTGVRARTSNSGYSPEVVAAATAEFNQFIAGKSDGRSWQACPHGQEFVLTLADCMPDIRGIFARGVFPVSVKPYTLTAVEKNVYDAAEVAYAALGPGATVATLGSALTPKFGYSTTYSGAVKRGERPFFIKGDKWVTYNESTKELRIFTPSPGLLDLDPCGTAARIAASAGGPSAVAALNLLCGGGGGQQQQPPPKEGMSLTTVALLGGAAFVAIALLLKKEEEGLTLVSNALLDVLKFTAQPSSEQKMMQGINDLAVKLGKIPSMKILPTQVATSIYTDVGQVANQALAAGSSFLNARSSQLGLDPASMESALRSLMVSFKNNLVPYQSAIKAANDGGNAYAEFSDTKFLIKVRAVLMDAWAVYATIIDQRAALSWVFSIPGVTTTLALLVGIRAAIDKLEAVLEFLLHLPGQVVDFTNKVVTYLTYAGFAFLGYKLFFEKARPWEADDEPDQYLRR